MGAKSNSDNGPSDMGGEELIKPGQERGSRGISKLPPIPANIGGADTQGELHKEWVEYMVHGFKNNGEMFQRTLRAFMKPYHLTVWMYAALFVVGLSLFVLAGILGFREGKSAVAIVFAGLGAGAFLAFFIRQPLQALEENLECISWLGVAFNTYWTRVMYMMDMKTIQADLKAADDDYRTSVERLITKHAELRGKRPGGESSADTGSDGGTKQEE